MPLAGLIAGLLKYTGRRPGESSLAIPGVDVLNQTAAALSINSLASLFGFKIDGIIGYDFIKNFVVEIDYGNSLLNLYEPQTYSYSGAGETIPITLIDNTPFVQGKLLLAKRDPIEGKFEVDTGGNGTLNVNTHGGRSSPSFSVYLKATPRNVYASRQALHFEHQAREKDHAGGDSIVMM